MIGKRPNGTRGAPGNSDDNGTSAFDTLVGELDYPMFVVTTGEGNQRSGCLVGFASQVSIAPPRFLVGLSNKNHTFHTALTTEFLAVHVIPRDHIELATLFGDPPATISTSSRVAPGILAPMNSRYSMSPPHGSADALSTASLSETT